MQLRSVSKYSMVHSLPEQEELTVHFALPSQIPAPPKSAKGAVHSVRWS